MKFIENIFGVKDDVGQVFILVALLAAYFVISYYWKRYVLEVERQLKNQEIIINLLAAIAEKQGVSSNQINEITAKEK